MEKTLLEHPLGCLLHWSKGETGDIRSSPGSRGQSQGATSKGQVIHLKKNKKKSLADLALSLQVAIPVAAAWFAEIPRACSPPVAQDDLQPFGKIQEIWVCSQTCRHLSGPSVPIQARISCTETKITFSKASCSETLQQNPQK